MRPTYRLDTLDLHGGPYWIKKNSVDFSTVGSLKFTLVVAGEDARQRILLVGQVQNIINEAKRSEAVGGSILFTVLRGGLEHSFYDVSGGTMLESVLHQGMTISEHEVELVCLPFVRTAPYTVTIAGTLSGDGAEFFVPMVPGDAPALAHLELTDTSASGVINRIRWFTVPGEFTGLSDYVAWVNAPIDTGASTIVDATSYGGSHGQRAGMTGLTHADLVRAVQPAGAQYKGRMDGYARVWGSGTAIGTPTSLAGTVVEPTFSTTPTSWVYNPIELGASGGQQSTSGTGTSATWSQTTIDGSFLMALQVSRASTTHSAPAGWSLAGNTVLTSEVGNEVDVSLWVIRDAAPRSGSENFTHGIAGTPTNPNTIHMVEWLNGDVNLATVLGSTAVDTSAPTIIFDETSFENELLVAFIVNGSNTGAPIDIWKNGFESRWNSANMSLATRNVDNSGLAALTVNTIAAFNLVSHATVAVNLKPQRTSVAGVTSMVGEAPGALLAGTYTARVRALDAARYAGNATASLAKVVVTDGGRIDWTWTNASNSVATEFFVQFGTKFYRAVTSASELSLTDLADLEEVSALPATSGAVAPQPFIRARIGTENDHVMSNIPEVLVPGTTARLVRVFSDRMLPPLDAPLHDTWLTWAVELQARSANGASATVNADALWIAPSRQPQGMAEIHGMAHGTKRRWVLESHRTGLGVIGWLENTGTGVEAGRLTTTGTLLFAAGKPAIASLVFEQAAELMLMAASVTATLTLYPRWAWGHGS